MNRDDASPLPIVAKPTRSRNPVNQINATGEVNRHHHHIATGCLATSVVASMFKGAL